MEEKKYIDQYIETNREILIKVGLDLYNHPELAFEEYYASQTLSDLLKTYGFEVEYPYASLDTAFCATFQSGQGGPVIGVLAEYDALSNGHSCGHHIIASSAVGAGIAIKAVLEKYELNATVKVIGTPAEETGGGKIIILNNGGFENLDAVLLLHPTTGVSKVVGRCKSSYSIEVTYTGLTSSAISRPEKGINATEAAVAAYQYLGSALRYLPNDVSIMPFITTANEDNGLLPDTSKLLVTFTAFEDESMNLALEKVKEVLKGAALITGNQIKMEELPGYKGRIVNHTIGDLLRQNMEVFGEDIMDGLVDDNGFEDFGNVNRVIPGAMVYPTIHPPKKVSNHTQEFLELAHPDKSYDTILLGSKVMASTALDLVKNPKLLETAKMELEN